MKKGGRKRENAFNKVRTHVRGSGDTRFTRFHLLHISGHGMEAYSDSSLCISRLQGRGIEAMDVDVPPSTNTNSKKKKQMKLKGVTVNGQRRLST